MKKVHERNQQQAIFVIAIFERENLSYNETKGSFTGAALDVPVDCIFA